MRHLRSMTPPRLIAGLLFGLLLAILAVPLVAQPATHTIHQSYDVKKEVILSGPVTGVVHGPSAGLTPGSHIMFSTGSGTIDASLGKWGLSGKEASIHNGEQVTVKGIMMTVGKRQVFFARTVEVGGQTYVVRNERGTPIAPNHDRVQKNAQKGVSL